MTAEGKLEDNYESTPEEVRDMKAAEEKAERDRLSELDALLPNYLGPELTKDRQDWKDDPQKVMAHNKAMWGGYPDDMVLRSEKVTFFTAFIHPDGTAELKPMEMIPVNIDETERRSNENRIVHSFRFQEPQSTRKALLKLPSDIATPSTEHPLSSAEKFYRINVCLICSVSLFP